MKKLIAICAVAVVACFTASAASANAYTATWTGTVTSGTDSLKFFQAGTDLANQAFTMVFTFDGTDMARSGSSIADTLIGPGATALLIINHQIFTIPSGVGTLGQDTVATFGGGYTLQQVDESSSVMSASDTNITPSILGSLDQSLSRTCNAQCVVSAQINDPGRVVLTGLDFNPTNFTLAATPIPAALPLFISALGGLGFVGWRRKQIHAA